jgi:hypothetical protein
MVSLLSDFQPYGIIYMTTRVCVCVLHLNYYTRCHGNTFKGHSTLWDNIYEYECVMLEFL